MRYGSKCFLWVVFLLFPQWAAGQEQYAFLVRFKDKDATTLSLDNPQAYLSQRALERRIKYGIGVDSTDLPVVASYVDSILHVTNGVLHLTSRWQNYAVILVPDSADILDIAGIGFVKDFKKVGYYATGLHQITPGADSNSTGGKPTGFDENYYGAAWNQIHLCNGEYLHSEGWRGNGKLIAVVDVGFDGVAGNPAFDSMFQEGRLLETYNFVLDTAYVYAYDAHGTKVLSCMASLMPETHVGTAPDASYVLYVTDDADREQLIEECNFVAAAERADSIGADLLTTSLGYNTFDDQSDNHVYADLDGHSTMVARAANSAAAKGMVMVVTAGNEGQSSWQYILTPGDADSAMTVGSVNGSKAPAATSGHGPNAAGRLKPDVCGYGVLASVITADGSLNVASGTSYATPVIAGLTACLMQALPDKSPYEIRSLIASVSDSFNTPNYTVGNGVPDFKKALGGGTGLQEGAVVTAVFKVFPNPADGYLVMEGEGSLEFSIADLQGRVLKKGRTISGRRIALGSLSKGIYSLRINNGRELRTMKLLVQ